MGSQSTPPMGSVGRGNAANACPVTFSKCAERFFATQKQKVTPGSMRRVGYLISRLTEFFGADRSLDSIKRRDVQSFVRQRARSAALGTVALEFGVLARILDVGVASGAIRCNVANDVPRPHKVRRPLRVLTPAEFVRIQTASPEWLRVISGFCLATSLTQAPAIEARWSCIRKRRGVPTLEISKGRKTWIVPLNKLALDSLDKARANRSKSNDRIFHGPEVSVINISQAFRRACRSVGIDDNVSFRTLRDTALAWQRNRGIDVDVLSLLPGRSSLWPLEPRVNAVATELVEALAVIDEMFQNATAIW